MTLSVAILCTAFAVGQTDQDPLKSNLNVKFPTLGGSQVWSDERIQGNWRIQKNVLTGHYRFLDNRNVRQAWGSLPACEFAFTKAVKSGKIPKLKPEAVVILHGLVRTRSSMSGLLRRVGETNPDWSVMALSYASSQQTIAEHSRTLRKVVAALDGVERVHFIAHSLGNLVVRRYLSDLKKDPAGLPKMGRIVMLGPPNQGSRLAELFKDDAIFRSVWGTGGAEIADWKKLSKTLAVPQSQFAIIAGGNKGNPLIKGKDDWVVSVEETKLAGAHDFLVLPVFHSTMMDNVKVQQATMRFLRSGKLRENGPRQPIDPQARVEENRK